VPVTVILSLTLLFAWAVSYLGARVLAPIMESTLAHWTLGSGVFLGSAIVGFLVTALVLRPIAGRIPEEEVRGGQTLVGRVCELTTGRVDSGFGQARLAGRGAELVLQVRCADDNDLRRGDALLIIDYDESQPAYVVCRAPDEITAGPAQLPGKT